MGPPPDVDLDDPIFIPVGDGLFVLSSGSFQVLYPPLKPVLSQSWEGTWRKLQKHPFKRRSVISYAVHPDGRTIFVSTRRHGAAATFTFDTVHLKWERHGEWVLPFTGRVHFDSKLDAWVGLSGDEHTYDGYLCACDAASARSDGSDAQQCPTSKLSKEKLFSEDKEHGRATLVYIGGVESKFCLVQCVSAGEELEEFMIRLTTFSLKFDKQGALLIDNRSSRCYHAPGLLTGFALSDPVAFWM